MFCSILRSSSSDNLTYCSLHRFNGNVHFIKTLCFVSLHNSFVLSCMCRKSFIFELRNLLQNVEYRRYIHFVIYRVENIFCHNHMLKNRGLEILWKLYQQQFQTMRKTHNENIPPSSSFYFPQVIKDPFSFDNNNNTISVFAKGMNSMNQQGNLNHEGNICIKT